MKPHKHAALIKAWADGAKIQFRAIPNSGPWLDGNENLIWDNWAEYRIKPEPKPDIVAVGILELDVFPPHLYKLGSYHTGFRVSEHWETNNVRVTFDGETGKLKLAEVLSA